MKISLLYALVIIFFISCNTTEPPIEGKWSVSGPLLFVSNESGTMQLYSMKIDGTDVNQLTDDPDFPITDAKWSPDGTKIALTSPSKSPDQYGSIIYIVNADGTNKYKIADKIEEEVHYGTGENPNWSSDSKSIVFSRIMYPEAIGNMDLYTIDIDGTSVKRITETYNLLEMWPSFSCNNTKILTMVIHGNITDSTGSSIQYFTTTEYDLEGNILNEFGIIGELWYTPIYSHDCSQIAFSISNSSNSRNIYTMDVNGNNIRQVTQSNFKDYRCVLWTNENLIYNAMSNYYQNKIFISDIAGNNVEDLTPFEAEKLEATSLRLNY